MLGVTGRYGKILDLIDFSDEAGEHTLLMPTSDLSEEETIEVLSDTAKGVYIFALFDQLKDKIENWEFKDPYGLSLVHHAARAQTPYFLKEIMHNHANLSMKDEQELTPLHHAAKANSLECIKLLIHENPDLLEAKGLDDETPLFIAIQSNSKEAVDLLLSLGANPNCIIINDLNALFWAI